jgi:hypothetical protein
LGYLYIAFATTLMILIVVAFLFFEAKKEKPNPRLSQKPKSTRNKENTPGMNPAVRRTSLKGEKYIPSYQSNPEAVKHVERFLRGAATRSDKSTGEKQSHVDEVAADEILSADKGQEHPAGEKDEKEAIKAHEPVQLELGMEDTKDQLPAVNE